MTVLTHEHFIKALTPKWRTLDDVRKRIQKLDGRTTQVTRYEAIPLAHEAVSYGYAQSYTKEGIVFYQITRKGQLWKNRVRRQLRKKKRCA